MLLRINSLYEFQLHKVTLNSYLITVNLLQRTVKCNIHHFLSTRIANTEVVCFNCTHNFQFHNILQFLYWISSILLLSFIYILRLYTSRSRFNYSRLANPSSSKTLNIPKKSLTNRNPTYLVMRFLMKHKNTLHFYVNNVIKTPISDSLGQKN